MLKHEIAEAEESSESEGHNLPRKTSIDKLHEKLSGRAEDDLNFIQAKIK